MLVSACLYFVSKFDVMMQIYSDLFVNMKSNMEIRIRLRYEKGKSRVNSWFAINLLGCGKQCQPPTLARSDNGTKGRFPLGGILCTERHFACK